MHIGTYPYHHLGTESILRGGPAYSVLIAAGASS